MKSNLKAPNKNWKVLKISDVLFFQEGPGVRKWQFTENGIKLLNVGNINFGEIDLNKTKIHISKEEAYGKYKHFLIDENDLLIACSGIVVNNFHNKIAFIKKEHLPLCLNTSTMRFKALDDKKTNLKYFSYFLKTNYFTSQLRKLITGSAQLNFGPSHIKQIDLLLPPLATQKKIAAILDEADKLRQLNKQLIDKYNNLTQSLFLDMFGDPVLNPMGWEKVELQKLTSKIGSGSTPRGGKQAYHKVGISLIRSLNIYDTKFKYKNLAFINDEQADKLKNVIIEKDDVLFNITGASICRSTIVPSDVLPARVNQHVSIIRCQKSSLNSLFLNYFLISKNIKNKLLGVGSGSGAIMQAITKEKLKTFKIITPPLQLQNEFAVRIKIIEQQKEQAQASLQASEQLFNSLLQKAFKGELFP